MVYYKLQENECGMKTVGSPAPLILSAEGDIGMKGRPIKCHHTFCPANGCMKADSLTDPRRRVKKPNLREEMETRLWKSLA